MGKLAVLQVIRRLRSHLSVQDSNLNLLQKTLGHKFKNEQLLLQSMTHKSMVSDPGRNYERLEFLGDAVIDHIVSEKLFYEFPEASEGILTQKRSALVQKSFLANMGGLLGFIDYIRVSSSVDLTQEKVSHKQLANVFEAVMGAMCLDGGLKPCERLIEKTVWSYRKEAWQNINYKGLLIEYCQANNLGTPRFLVTDTVGPEHEKTFEVSVKIGERSFPPATGETKKAAEQEAAQISLDFLSP